MLTKILPPAVACSEQIGKFSGFLVREEEEALGPNAVQKRRESFTAGRTCARQALRAIGMPEVPILRGREQEPIWPEGIVGSITHCDAYCAAALAYDRDFISLGIDAETNEPLTDGVLALVALQAEIDWLRRAPKSFLCWDKLLFSIKESVYKSWYPLARCWLGFEQVLVAIEPETESFIATVLSPTSAQAPRDMLSFQGRYLVEESLIVTAICISRHPPSQG
jgi:4'-phosphopantetheinyl transferase EntD